MRFAAIDQPGAAGHSRQATTADSRRMSRTQLRQLGVQSYAYLRAGVIDGRTAIIIHAADGRAIAVVDDIELAFELVAEQGMAFVAVH